MINRSRRGIAPNPFGTTWPGAKQRQLGYLLEVPLVLAAVGILIAILLPRLPPVGVKALIIFGALVLLGGLYYMIVTPGWQPGNSQNRSRIQRLVAFSLVAIAIVSATVAYVIFG